MRTVQRTYTLFGIAELEDEARQRAYTDWLAKGNDYPYASENCDTLEAFCNLFRIACTNYRYDSCTYYYRFYTKHETDTEELSGVRLLAYLYNNFHAELYKPKVYWTKDRKKRRRSRISVTCECPFTGVVSDEIILQPFMDFMRSPDTRNFKELMRETVWKTSSARAVTIASIARARNISRTRATGIIGSTLSTGHFSRKRHEAGNQTERENRPLQRGRS